MYWNGIDNETSDLILDCNICNSLAPIFFAHTSASIISCLTGDCVDTTVVT